MAVIQKLSINQFRNLDCPLVEPSPNFNLLIGDNAQGKTNFIESIYYLGHNRSFKTKNLNQVIAFDRHAFQLQAQVDQNRLNIEKSRKKNKININNKSVKNTSELTQFLPIQIITPDKGFVVGGNPKNKRSCLDWGVFHVKPELSTVFSDYKKSLKNINFILSKNTNQNIEQWLFQLAKSAQLININRNNYIEKLKQHVNSNQFSDLSSLCQTIQTLDYQFHHGWTKEVDGFDEKDIYRFLLKQTKFKYLNHGSHKAKLTFVFENRSEDFLSRGEQKTLSIAFWLMQVSLLSSQGKPPIVLIDDIASELDTKKLKTVFDFLQKLKLQIFITNLKKIKIPKNFEAKIFSIIDGKIKTIN